MIGLDREESGNGGIGDERINHGPPVQSRLEVWSIGVSTLLSFLAQQQSKRHNILAL